MKDPFVRTKVVLRHLPPTLSQSALTEQIDGRFAGRYKWFSFRPGKNSLKHQKYSRAYIDFRRPEDVIEFAEFFDGHVFVNEKGTQIKAIVEYAPSQRVPKSWCKKDGREGTILKDPEYLEFLEFLAKPVENLPSAEIQLEKREAERAGASKEPRVTALMDFIRKNRAANSEMQRLSSNGKPSRRGTGGSPGNSRPTSSKRGSEKRRGSTSMYVQRDNTKNVNGKDKSAYSLASRRDGSSPSDKPASAAAESGAEIIADDSATSGAVDFGKKKVTLLKGNRDIVNASQQQSGPSPVRNNSGSPVYTQRQPRREVGGKIIRSILSNKEPRGQSQSSSTAEQQSQPLHSEKEKRPPRSSNMRLIPKDHFSESDGKRVADGFGNDSHGSVSINERQERHNNTRNRDRPDRCVWSQRRSDGSDENLSLDGISITNKLGEDSSGKQRNFDTRSSGEIRILGGNRGGSSLENGSHRYGGRRGPAHGGKDADGTVYPSEGKPPKRGGATGYETKQKWVQKSASGL